MSFEKNFCASPWIHMRINNSGAYEYCRWANKENRNHGASIQHMLPVEYFQTHMQSVRNSMLAGTAVEGCRECHQMEQHGKVSGRQRQLLKVGVRTDNFSKTLLSSPWINEFKNSSNNLLPQDWQIDLGNFCNSGCVFCSPESSSKLAAEFKKLKIISQTPVRSWAEDPAQLEKFLDTIARSPSIKYLHFIGGETLITPAFKLILKELIAQGINHTCSIGFTTNLHCWDQEAVDLLIKFKEVNLGVSIECVDALNDYVRWPSSIEQVKTVFEKWYAVSQQHHWFMQLRTTPTWLTVSRLLTVYDWAWQHSISIESCNFLQDPAHFRISVLPEQHRRRIVNDMQHWIHRHSNGVDISAAIYNTRSPATVHSQILQDLNSYVDYLEHSDYQTNLLPASVEYLKLLESNRKNSILDYLPEYEELLRSAGY